MNDSWDTWETGADNSIESTKRCSVCQETKPLSEFYQRRRFPLCKKCGREARAAGKTIRIKAAAPSEVSSIKDFIEFSEWRLGCKPKNYKANNIIISYSGYSIKDLAETVEWCVSNGKHPDEPWKVMFWVEEYLDNRQATTQDLQDPIERRLQELYSTAGPEDRKRIRSVSGKRDKTSAMALIRELSNG